MKDDLSSRRCCDTIFTPLFLMLHSIFHHGELYFILFTYLQSMYNYILGRFLSRFDQIILSLNLFGPLSICSPMITTGLSTVYI